MKRMILMALFSSMLLCVYAQNVGVGIASPLYKLHIHGDLFINSSQGNFIIGYPGPDNKWHFATTNGGADLLVISETPAAAQNTRMYFTQAGLIGIGTSSPTFSLDIKSPNPNMVRFNGPSNMYITISENDNYRGYIGSFAGAADDVDFGTGAATLGKTHIVTGAVPRLTVDNSGDVGIGTTTPAVRLHLKTTGSEVLRAEGSLPYMSLYDNIDGYRAYWLYDGTNVGFGTAGGSNSVLRLTTNGITKIYINTDGRVVIGTSNIPATGYALSVDGKVISEEIKVQISGSWPDYVFKKGYELMPLNKLEESIQKNQHLPNIPSAATVEKDGILLGDMNKRLLEKIEELTLYIIELNKKNEQQAGEIAEIKKQLSKNRN